MDSIADLDVYIVKKFYEPERVLAIRDFAARLAKSQPPSWHPCLDGVPDYHRVNDEYERSWVRGKLHGFYFHYFNDNRWILEQFKDLLELKNGLRGAEKDADYTSLPSAGVISRVVSQHYPRGGGYLSEHVDPASDFAMIQTIIQASTPGRDFSEGGLYFRASEEAEPVYLDGGTEPGDLIVLTPNVRHGVAPIDPSARLDWELETGRWMVLPIILRSDYNMDPATKPRQIAASS